LKRFGSVVFYVWLVAVFAMFIQTPSHLAFAEEPTWKLVGDCLPVADNQTWDCRLEGNAKTSGDFIVACESEPVKSPDQDWYHLDSLSNLNEFIDGKYAALGLREFSQWTACQGFETKLSARREGQHVFSLQVFIYDSRSQHKKPMTENWPWWCAEMPSFFAILTDGFGCFVPQFYTFGIEYLDSGRIRERVKQVPY
jgi:hypothetical protein